MCVSGEFLTVESNASKSLHCRPQFSGNSRWSYHKKVSSSVRAVSKYSGCNPWLNEWVLSLVGSCSNHLLPTSPSRNLIMVPIVPSPAHRSFPVLLNACQTEGTWTRVYCRLAPGSKSNNNMAAVMEVMEVWLVSPQIDHLINSMGFFEEKRLAIWEQCLILSWHKFSDVNRDCRERPGARSL